MATSTLSSKGQITVPKLIREHLHVVEGDQVDFAIAANGDVITHRINGSISALAGLLHRPDREAVSREKMDQAIASAVINKVGNRR